MTERPAAAESEVAAAERDVLLATKLHVPGPRPGFVPRPRLADRLDEGLGRGLVLVCAPAGSGKTALLADWARRGRRPVAWLSLDAGDNDPARFWRHAVAALDGLCPGIGERVGPLLGPPPPPSFEPLVTALINELTARPEAGEVLLVLDDYHLVGSQPVHASVGFLLEHLPPGLHPVLASRADPPLALARLRARGQLAELRAAELRFTADEAAAMLREAAGAELPDAAVAALAARAEGWAAGLQLAGLSLRGQEDVAGFVAAFTGSHRYVLDYLAEEVLERQSEQVRAFLLETSVLERLSGALCDAVTGRTGSQALLEQVERAGLFLVPLDEVRGWWRYHHLFADLLRARLQAEQPGRVAQLHRNAAAWYEEHGLADDAIRHAVATGEMTWAARLIERHFDALYSLRGEAATIQRWLSALPDETGSGPVPGCCWRRRLLAAASGRVEAVEPLLDAAEHVSAGAAEEPFEPTVGRADSLLVNVARADRAPSQHISPSSAVTPRPRPRSLRRPWPSSARASGCWTPSPGGTWPWPSGSAVGSRRPSAPSCPASPGGGRPASPLSPPGAAMNSARFSVPRAAWTRPSGPASRHWKSPRRPAGRRCRPPARHMWAWPRWPISGTSSTPPSRHVTEGIALCRQFVYTPPLAAGLVTLAWIRQANG